MEGFAVTCPLAPDAPRLRSGFCSSPRSFGFGFLQTPPRDGALAVSLASGSTNTWLSDSHRHSHVPCPAHTLRFSGGASAPSAATSCCSRRARSGNWFEPARSDSAGGQIDGPGAGCVGILLRSVSLRPQRATLADRNASHRTRRPRRRRPARRDLSPIDSGPPARVRRACSPCPGPGHREVSPR